MSLGYIRGVRDQNPAMVSTIQRDAVTVAVPPNAKNVKWMLLLISSVLSVGAFAIQVALGLAFIPTNVLFNFEHYGRDTLVLLSAMGKYIRSNVAFALLAWLLPILPAAFLPLKFTAVPLGTAAIVVSIIIVGSFLSPIECIRFVEMLRAVPELGYMWYETITIGLAMLIVDPAAFPIIWGGPVASVCVGKIETRRPWPIFVVISVLSIVFVLPTAHVFINEDGEFFLLGYSTNSLAGTTLSFGFVLIWVRTYHLVCRDVYLTFKHSKRACDRVLAVCWALLGTALVETWVSSAFSLHFAYVSYMNLELESTFLQMVQPALKRCVKQPRQS